MMQNFKRKDVLCRKKKIKIKITVFVFWAIIIGSALWYGRAFSYNDTITHPSLTGNVAKVYNANFEQKLTDQEINWLKLGSIQEDTPPRWLNHFYDSNTEQGLWGNFSSKQWAQDSWTQSLALGGNQTWQKAIEAYAKNDKKAAFVALGHVLHLLEDATVPAHTRLDAHPEGDPYESYAVDKIGKNINFNVTPITVKKLNEAFNILANYSSKYFLSEDTIKYESLQNEEVIIEKIGINKFIEYIKGVDDSGRNFHLVLIEGSYFNKNYITNDNSVHSDYFSLLAPKAISYGAGTIKLFFDEAEKRKKEEENKSWWQKLKEKASGWLESLTSSNLISGIGNVVLNETENDNDSAPSEAKPSEVPTSPSTSQGGPGGGADEPAGNSAAGNIGIGQYSLPSNTVVAQDKIIVKLPANTVMAQEKTGGDIIIKEITPDDADIPSAIVEEVNPSQLTLPKPSPTPSASPLVSLPGSGSAPTPSPSPDSGADTTAPETSITSAPAATVATTTAVFIFTSSESSSTFGCQLDGAATSSCSSPQEYNNLSEVNHNFKVSATDAAGNQDLTPAEHSWVVDLTAPQLSNIASTTSRTAASISWTASETGIFQIAYGTSTDYDLTSATTSASNLTLTVLLPNTEYHFKILAQDSLANATTTGDNIFTTTAQAENVIISEIKIGNVGEADDEWIELYNPTNADIDLESLPLKLHIRNSVGTDNNKIINFTRSVIPAKGFFLLASATNYTGGVPADATYSTSGIKLVSNGGIYISMSAASSTNVIDQVGWGSQPFDGYENTAFTDNPSSVQSLERKANATSSKELLVNGVHQWLGNGYDSDNNSQDFVLQTSPNPQNSLMLTEPLTSLPNLMTASAWPTWQKDLARTGQTSAVSLATSTMVTKWATSTVATKEFNSRPVLDSSGNIYIGRADGLAKYSSDGNLIWLYSPSTNVVEKAVYTPPLIASDGTIYFRGAWGLYAVNQDGQLRWKYALSGTGGNYAALAILSDGTIITQSAEEIMAINQDATLKWIFDPGRAMSSSNSIGAFVIDPADNIYVTVDNYIYALDKNKTKLWEKSYGTGYTSLALGADNLLYVSTATSTSPKGGLYALEAGSGIVKWADAQWIGFNNKAYLPPVIDSANKIYTLMFFTDNTRNLRLYSATSSAVNIPDWVTENSAINSVNLAAPILTSDGKIYLANQNFLKVFDAASGELDGFFNSGDNSFYLYFGAVGSDGVIYAASNLSLYAIDDN